MTKTKLLTRGGNKWKGDKDLKVFNEKKVCEP